jgi:hypothetical protein
MQLLHQLLKFSYSIVRKFKYLKKLNFYIREYLPWFPLEKHNDYRIFPKHLCTKIVQIYSEKVQLTSQLIVVAQIEMGNLVGC